MTIWPQPTQPLQSLLQEVIRAVGLVSLATVQAELNFPRTQDGLVGLLRQASLTEVSGETVSWRHETDLEEWWIGPANGLGALGIALAGQPEAVVAEARRQYEILAVRHITPDGVLSLSTAALLASGTRAAP